MISYVRQEEMPLYNLYLGGTESGGATVYPKHSSLLTLIVVV